MTFSLAQGPWEWFLWAQGALKPYDQKSAQNIEITQNLKNSKQYGIWSITNGISSYYEKS